MKAGKQSFDQFSTCFQQTEYFVLGGIIYLRRFYFIIMLIDVKKKLYIARIQFYKTVI